MFSSLWNFPAIIAWPVMKDLVSFFFTAEAGYYRYEKRTESDGGFLSIVSCPDIEVPVYRLGTIRLTGLMHDLI